MDEQPVERDSPSEVLRATHVLRIRLEDVQMGEWMPEPGGPVLQRFVNLRVAVEDVLKGKLVPSHKKTFELIIVQRGTGTLRVFDDYGVWSRVELAPGLRLVAFCAGASSVVAELLQPPQCELLYGKQALPEIAAVLAIERLAFTLKVRSALEVSVLLPALADFVSWARLLEWHGGILARYIWARVKNTVLVEPRHFLWLIHLIERPSTTPEAREVLVTSVHEHLSLTDTPPLWAVHRLARGMLVLLTVPWAEAMHGNLAQVYLPNLLGLNRGQPVVTAADVLANKKLLLRVRRVLEARPELDPAGQLLGWLLESPRPERST